MTPRERDLAVLHGGRPDVLPRLPILMQFAAEHIGSYCGAFASDYRVLVEANLRCAEEFGIDQLNTMSDPYRETAGFGAPNLPFALVGQVRRGETRRSWRS